MQFALWSVIVGLLLVTMALGSTVLKRLPLSTAMLYLGVGVVVSPLVLGLLPADARRDTVLLERIAEVVVLLSLFTAGLKLSPGLRDHRWRLPVRLAVGSMAVTVFLVAAVALLLTDLPLGACVLLGAVLAPTDPVLASEVQVQQPEDQDRLRFALTGEGGLNDGTAFPFVMLGLGLLGLHEMGAYGWRWWAVDVLWAVVAGLGVGALLGLALGRLVLYLRRKHREAPALDDFLALGLIALSYGSALLIHAYGFLAVFAAGVALRQLEQSSAGEQGASAAPGFMTRAVLGFNQQAERIGEVAIVITLGALLWSVQWQYLHWWFAPVLLLVIRPLSIVLGMWRSSVSGVQGALIGWFGIRGVGSVYYLMFAVNHGLPQELADRMVALTLSVVVASILLHGISVTPLMAAYERAVRRREHR